MHTCGCALKSQKREEGKITLAKSIVFHSYKGGTGKTTIAANIAAVLAKRGYRVLLLDLDVYAPSLHSYFEIEPSKWLNDFLHESAEAKDIMIDLTSSIPTETAQLDSSAGGDGTIRIDSNSSSSSSNNPLGLTSPSQIKNYATSTDNNDQGKLWVTFANPQKDEVYKLEGGKQEKVQLLRRFIALREEIFSNFNIDYFIIDTSPGIRYWSINALAIADMLYLTLKAGDLDIAGTKKMVADIYSTFSKFGARPYLLLNRVAGYCVPHTLLLQQQSSGTSSSSSSSAIIVPPQEGSEAKEDQMPDEMLDLSKQVGINIISALPCYCDIQFSKKEFLTVLARPNHPFAKKIASLVEQTQAVVAGGKDNIG
jgi:MinD-like ATPase involved in chromosome partitioning or flagellar assembly